MNCLDYFKLKSLIIDLAGKDSLKIKGLSSLQGELKKQVVEYAKINKQEILFEIRMQSGEIQGGDSHLFCPARCKRTGKCYGMAYFDGKSGRKVDCIPCECQYKDRLWAYLSDF